MQRGVTRLLGQEKVGNPVRIGRDDAGKGSCGQKRACGLTGLRSSGAETCHAERKPQILEAEGVQEISDSPLRPGRGKRSPDLEHAAAGQRPECA